MVAGRPGMYSAYVYMSGRYWGGKSWKRRRYPRFLASFICAVRSAQPQLYRNPELITNGVPSIILTPNAQGKLVLQFEPEHDYASIADWRL